MASSLLWECPSLKDEGQAHVPGLVLTVAALAMSSGLDGSGPWPFPVGSSPVPQPEPEKMLFGCTLDSKDLL